MVDSAHTTIAAARIRARLAGTRLAEAPDRIAPASAGRPWPAAFLERFGSGLLAAAVLIPIVERDNRLTVLLTERAADLTHHAGQISFPGGRMETSDADLTATALRETHEEVGIRPEQVDVAGYLDAMPTVSGYAVTAVVGLVAPPLSLRLDRAEVAQAFEVPLDFLMDAANQQHSTRDVDGIVLPLIEYRYGSRRIWGATAAMLAELQRRLAEPPVA